MRHKRLQRSNSGLFARHCEHSEAISSRTTMSSSDLIGGSSRMIFRINETGRSLTEMLGTLSIMGILSVVGMWMYGVAMDKLRANELVNEAQKRAVVVAGQIGLMGRKDPTLVEFTDNAFAGGTFATEVTTEGLYQQFGIKVSGVNKRICQNIVNGIGNSSPIRRVAHATDPTNKLESCADDNTFLMIYNNDLSGAENDTKYCEDSQCQTVCGHNCIMKDDTPTCQDECPTDEKTCTQNSDCTGECVGCVIPEGEATGTCQACQRVAYLESDGNQWIDTGYIQKVNPKITSEFAVTSTADLDIFGNQGASATCFIVDYYPGRLYYRYSNVISTQLPNAITLDHFDTWAFSEKVVRNGTVILEVQNNINFSSNRHKIFLFRGRTLGHAKIKYVKIEDNNTLVRDFVPVLDPYGVPAMFDKVNHQLYYNQGSGADFKTNLN